MAQVLHLKHRLTSDQSKLKFYFAFDPMYSITWVSPSEAMADSLSQSSSLPGGEPGEILLRQLVIDTMFELKAQRFLGAAPRSNLEHQLQKAIDRHRG